MNMPGFTAEASLYKARALYRMNETTILGAENNIFPS